LFLNTAQLQKQLKEHLLKSINLATRINGHPDMIQIAPKNLLRDFLVHFDICQENFIKIHPELFALSC